MLRAEWDYIVSGRMGRWQLIGGTSGLHSQFEALARRAAFELANADASDLLIAWLDELKQTSFQPGSHSYYDEQHADGTDGPCHLTGTIYGKST
jgi:hypothetical protein